MTTTSTFQGLDQGARNSSRVLAPPGGGSSNIFGNSDDDSQRKNVRSSPQNINRGNNDIFGNREQLTGNSSPGKKHNPDNVNCGNSDIFNRESHAAPAQPKSRAPRSEYNPITGVPYEQPAAKEEARGTTEESQAKKDEGAAAAEAVEDPPQQQQQKGHPGASSGIFGGPEPSSRVQASTRVSQPPGGRSTRLW